jgi:tetratricopeptide (TPR) repeat protein
VRCPQLRRKMRKIAGYSVLALCMGAMLLPGRHVYASPSKYAFVCDDRLPVTPRCYLARGKKEEWDRQFGPALADFNKVIQQQPGWYAPYVYRAIIYVYQSQYDLAMTDATTVIRLSPDPGMGYGLRATAYIAKGVYSPAISDATRAIELGPAYRYISLALRGQALSYSGQPTKAVLDFSNAISLKNDKPFAYYGRAGAYEEIGQRHQADMDYVRALSLLNSAIAATPNDCFLYEQRGLIFERTGREDQAIADETRALALDRPGPAYAYVYRGLAYGHKGLDTKAAADLESAVRIDRFSKLEWDRMKHLEARSAARK